MQHYLKVVGNGQRTARGLTHSEAEVSMELIASPAQIGALMAILRIKEESVEVELPYLADICVPYDGGAKSPILILAAAFIAVACGVQVALHGRAGGKTGPKFDIGAWQAQIQVYQIMPDAALLCWEEVGLLSPVPTIPEKHSITCDICQDRINEHREVIIQGKILCRPCAYGVYYAAP
ncbi:MAG: TraR/DksA C4-type zinc finger protein [Chloroflexi bacterium]|nr:TraR/DksA C4-type zinc finger protein [Chloroflexota bacterium]